MSMLNESLKSRALYLMLWQLLVIICLAGILGLLQGCQAGFSALMGGLSYWLPTLIFALRIFTYASAQAAKQFILAFFMGEVVKLFLSAALFIGVVNYLPVSVLSTLIGFVSAILAFWVVWG